MTQEDKELLLKDLCARLPYGVILSVTLKDKYDDIVNRNIELTEHNLSYITKASNWQEYKPYLRPMSSMTEEEKEEIKPLFSEFTDEFGKRILVVRQNKMALYQDWLNKNMFDYRGLIPMGLAIEVTEENNPYK